MKRTIGVIGSAILFCSALSACTSTATNSEDTLVVAGFAAEYEDLFKEVIAKPFTEETGIKIEYSSGSSASEYYAQIRASQGEPGFDAVVMTYPEVYQGAQDELLAPITEEEVPNLAGIPDTLRDVTQGVSIVQDVQYISMMYNKSAFPEPPTSWNDIWDPKYRSGALLFNPSNFVGVLQILVAAGLDGGDEDNVEPGFKRIAELAQYAAGTPTTSAEAVPFMEQGTATAFPYLDGRAAIYAQEYDYDYTIPKEGTYASLGTLSLPTGATNKEAAYKLMDFWLRPEIQKKWAEAYNVGPSVTGIEFDPEFAEKHITTPEQLADLKIADAATILEKRSDWSQTWAEAIQ